MAHRLPGQHPAGQNPLHSSLSQQGGQTAPPANPQVSTQPQPHPHASGAAAPANPVGVPVPTINPQPRGQMAQVLANFALPPLNMAAAGVAPTGGPQVGVGQQGGAQTSGAQTSGGQTIGEQTDARISPRALPMTPRSKPKAPPPPPPNANPATSVPSPLPGNVISPQSLPSRPRPPQAPVPANAPQPSQPTSPRPLVLGSARAATPNRADAPTPKDADAPEGKPTPSYFGHQRRSSMPMMTVRTDFVYGQDAGNPITGSASSVVLPTTTTTTATTTTTTTTGTTAATRTTNTTSLPSVSDKCEERAEERQSRRTRRNEGPRVPRGKSMERILAPDSAGEIKLPSKLTRPEVMAEKMARAETSDFSAIGTRKDGLPIYRGSFPKTVENYWSTIWRPMVALLAGHLDTTFAEVERQADALFDQWKTLADTLDNQTPEQRRAMLELETGLTDKERRAIEASPARLNEKSLSTLQSVRTLLLPALQPLLDGLNGDGKSLLSSILPPTILQHLLELDRQHVTQWAPTSKRLLDWKLFYNEMQGASALVTQLRAQDPEAETLAALVGELKSHMQQWQQHESMLAKKGSDGQAELAALRKLTEKRLSPDEAFELQDQIKQHDVEFRETRRLALGAFICIRACAVVLQFRAMEVAEGDAVKSRMLMVLRELALEAIPKLRIIDQLMDCSPVEREAVRQAAEPDFPRQQEKWDSIREDRSARNRLARLRKAEESREKKKDAHRHDDPSINSASASDKPGARDADNVAPKERKRLSQPSKLLKGSKKDELLARREKRVQRFLDEYGIAEKARTVPQFFDKSLLTGLQQNLRAMAQDKVTDELLLKKAIAYLGEALITMEGAPSNEMRALVADLGSALIALQAASHSSQSIAPKAEDKPQGKPGANDQ